MSHIVTTELYTKESTDSKQQASLEVLIPDPDEETAKMLISKNTLDEDNDGPTTRAD